MSARREKQTFSFTKPLLEALPPAAAGKRDYYNDTKLRGLQLAVTDSGAKTFYLYRRIKGRPTRCLLGRFPDLTPELARRKAEGLAGRIAFGEDVVSEARRAQTRQVTLEEAFERFTIVRSSLKPTTLAGYQNFVNGPLASWKTRRLVEITKDQIGERHRALTREHGPAYADGAMRFLRSLLNFANAEYEAPDGTPLLPYNPIDRLTQTRAWNRVHRRTTVIKPSQLGPWFAAVEELRASPERLGVTDTQGALVADYLTLLLLTGLRRSEGAQLKWVDVDFAEKTLIVRDTKNRDDHVLPLSDHLEKLLTRRKEVTEGEFVFPGAGAKGYLYEPRPQMAKITARSGVPFHLHDLRRTFATVAESLDINHYALKRLLNHRSQDITQSYVIANVDRLRKPMQAITDFMLRCAELKPTASVTQIPTSAAQ
jgi:integrase